MILHLDLDCFFAAAHRIDNKSLENIPIAVGSRSNLSIFDKKNEKRQLSNIDGAFTSAILTNNSHKSFEEYFVENNKIRGIITTSSYEARAYGVKTAMPVALALRYCPNLIVLPPNYPLYHQLSYELRRFLERMIPTIEQFSIDEFFGDVGGWIEDDEVEEFAKLLKQQIYEELKLPISIGIAKTKWIAKLATNMAKPFGVKMVLDNEIDNFLKGIPISKFPGIGRSYQSKLNSRGIKTLDEIKDHKELFYSWGKTGIQLYNRILGLDDEKIQLSQDQKSIGLGRTFDPLFCRDEAIRRVVILCRHLSFLAIKNQNNPTKFTLYIKYQYGNIAKDFVNLNSEFVETIFKNKMIELFKKIDIHTSHAIVQINITISHFSENKLVTMDIFSYMDNSKMKKITNSIHKLREKFGIDIIKNANEI